MSHINGVDWKCGTCSVEPAEAAPTCFFNGAGESAVAIRQDIDALADRAPITWEQTAHLVDPGQRPRISKLLPDIERGVIARETMNVDVANAMLVEWKRGTARSEGNA